MGIEQFFMTIALWCGSGVKGLNVWTHGDVVLCRSKIMSCSGLDSMDFTESKLGGRLGAPLITPSFQLRFARCVRDNGIK